MPSWPDEAEEGGIADAWVQRGQVYAEGIRLLRAQLRNAPENTKEIVDRLLRNLNDTEQMGPWDQLVHCAILPELQGSPDYAHWQKCSNLIRSSMLTPAQLLGIALEMAREQQLGIAIDGLKRLLNEHPGIDRGEQLHFCSEFVASIDASHFIKDAHSDQDGLERVIALYEQMAGLMAVASSEWSGADENAIPRNTPPLFSKLDAINDSQRQCPKEVDRQIWGELLMNACSTSDPRTPNLLLIESRSLPRSGHHFLKRLLEQALGQDFSYCEGYEEPGCCQKSPCSATSYWHYARANHRPHLRLVKSHDFSLRDVKFAPMNGMIRLIQIRKPFDLLASWLELRQLAHNQKLLESHSISPRRIWLYHEKELLEDAWQVIDKYGCVMDASEVKLWLNKQSIYLKSFLEKWLPGAEAFPFGTPVKSGNFVLRYDDLARGSDILQSLGFKADKKQDLPIFHKRGPEVTIRKSKRITELIRAQDALLREVDDMIIKNFEELAGIW